MAHATGEKVAAVSYLIEFEEAGHRYYVDGVPTISTTQVIKDAGMVDDRWFEEWHRWRGSEAHKAIATWNRAGNLDRRTIDPRIRPYVEAAIKWQKDTGFKPLFVEKRLYDPLFDVCGTLDAQGSFADGKADVIVDWKSNDHRMGQLTSKWQLASYGHAVAPKEVFRRIEVVIGPDGNYGPVNSFGVETYLADVNDFYALRTVARLRREGGLLT